MVTSTQPAVTGKVRRAKASVLLRLAGRLFQMGARVSSRWTPSLAAPVLRTLFTYPRPRPVTSRERGWMADARRSVVSMPEMGDLAVYSWGEGPVVLLVHGWSGRGSQLSGYVAPLRDLGFRVVCFDLPGHGESHGRIVALPDLAVAVARVADAVGPIEGVLAHSLGAAATTIALADGMGAQRLVYLAAPEDLSGYLRRLAVGLGFSEDIAARAQRQLERRHGRRFTELRASSLSGNLDAALMLIHDADDCDVPLADSQRLRVCWPGARLMVTQGLGHLRIVRDSRVMARTCAFLADQSDG